MKKPRLLDLFCGAGGAAMGYHRAGFDVVGVDVKPQPRYPFRFVQADALNQPFRLQDFDAIHASPPCQAFTQMSARWRGKGGKADSHPNHLAPMLARLAELDIPWVVENVVGAAKHMRVSLKLHGGMFGLGVHRPRLFQSNVLLLGVTAPQCADPIGVYGPRADGRRLFTRKNMQGRMSIQRAAHSADEACAAMGIDHEMTWDEVREAIPPAYTEFIGRQLLQVLERAA